MNVFYQGQKVRIIGYDISAIIVGRYYDIEDETHYYMVKLPARTSIQIGTHWSSITRVPIKLEFLQLDTE